MQHTMCDAIHRGEHGWWYRGRKAAVRALGVRTGSRPRGRGLDYGAGFGGMYSVFAGCDTVDAYEVLPDGRAACSTHGYTHIYERESDLLKNAYDHIGIFDVLEHLEEDGTALRYIHDLLVPGGTLVGTVPAYQFLFGKHDVENNHYRRYTKRTLTDTLARAGFEIRAISYWNMALFPVATALRGLHAGHANTQLTPLPFLDAVLGAIVTTEARLLRYVPLPCGLSIAFVAQRIRNE